MRNIWKIFKSDLKALNQNVISVILTVGLVIMPSMFVWYNVLACWDVFGHTGNLKVAVANADEGYKSDLLPIEVNVGNEVVNALRGNDQMKWVFTSEEDAIDGAAGGRYYAALVIPKSFSQEMLTFYSSDAERAPILYYSNEKKSAVAPKVTSQGADEISYQVNKVFASTLSEVTINLLNSAIDLTDDETTTDNMSKLLTRISDASDSMKQQATLLSSFIDLVSASQDLVRSSKTLLDETKDSVKELNSDFNGSDETIDILASALESTTDSLTQSINSSISNYQNTADSIDSAFDSGNSTAEDVANSLASKADRMDSLADSYEKVIDSLQAIKDKLPAEQKPAFDQFVQVLQSSIDFQRTAADTMRSSAEDVRSSNSAVQAKHDEIKAVVDTAVSSLREVETTYNSDFKPKLEEVSSNVAAVSSKLQTNYEKLNNMEDALSSSMTDAGSKLVSAKTAVESAASGLNEASDKLTSMHDKLVSAMESGGIQEVKDIIGNNPSLLAENISAPVGIERVAEFPVSSFGAAMSPLYATLGLWVGCLLSVVLIKVNPSAQTISSCKRKPRLCEMFLGRFGVFAVVSLLQSTVLSLGNLIFLGIQVSNPFLYVLCFWVAGLVFQFIMYTLVATFGNVGKAIAVLLLIFQVTGAGGSFPLQLLPEYATAINPFLPASYVVNAMRASMTGLYQFDYWIYLGKLLLFLLPMALIGLVFRRPFVKANDKFVELVEKSKLI